MGGQVLQSWERVQITADGWVFTPAGAAPVKDTRFVLEGTHTQVNSGSEWSTPGILLAIVVSFFTCGLGLIVFLLARRERVTSRPLEIVRVEAPGWVHVGYAPGGAGFCAWANNWGERIRAHDALMVAGPPPVKVEVVERLRAPDVVDPGRERPAIGR